MGVAGRTAWMPHAPRWGGERMKPLQAALFGNRTAACVLLFLQCYGPLV